MGEELQISDFDYHLPEELIAQEPCPQRDHARLLVVDRRTPSYTHRHAYDLPELLRTPSLWLLAAAACIASAVGVVTFKNPFL